MKKSRPELPRSAPPTDGYRTLKGVGIASVIQQRAAFIIGMAFLLAAGLLAIRDYYLSPENPSSVESFQEEVALGSSGRLSIAVLPFDNLSEDPDLKKIAGGVRESIAAALSTFPDFSVVPPDSEMAYESRQVKSQVPDRSRDVQYVLKGDFRKAGTRTRVTVVLIDAATDQPVWSWQSEQDLTDINSFQDVIAGNVLTGMRMKFREGGLAGGTHIGADSSFLKGKSDK